VGQIGPGQEDRQTDGHVATRATNPLHFCSLEQWLFLPWFFIAVSVADFPLSLHIGLSNRATSLTMKRSSQTLTAISGRQRCDSRLSMSARNGSWDCGSFTLCWRGSATLQSLPSTFTNNTATSRSLGPLPLRLSSLVCQCKDRDYSGKQEKKVMEDGESQDLSCLHCNCFSTAVRRRR